MRHHQALANDLSLPDDGDEIHAVSELGGIQIHSQQFFFQVVEVLFEEDLSERVVDGNVNLLPPELLEVNVDRMLRRVGEDFEIAALLLVVFLRFFILIAAQNQRAVSR